jgi:intracellular multiplication protein IcmE
MSTDFNETPGAARYRKGSGGGAKDLLANPIVKLALVVVVVGGVGFAGMQYMSKRQRVEETNIPVAQTATTTNSDPTEASPEYLQAVQQLDTDRAEQAAARGESAMPTPMAAAVASPDVDVNAGVQDTRDPLRDFESLINQSAKPAPEPKPGKAEVPIETVEVAPVVPPELVQQYSRSYRAQMEMLMGQWNPTQMTTVSGGQEDPDEVAGENYGGSGMGSEDGGEDTGRVLVNAGSVYYGQMLMEANSDIPGPIMAQILTGPLAGGRAIGMFEVFREHLALRFKTVVIRGKELSVDILALDPDTTLGGVVTEVDHRYFGRVLVPAATEFVSAFGEAISEPESSTTVQSGGLSTTSQGGNDTKDALYKGMGEAFKKVSEFMEEEGSEIKRLVRVGVGTPIALFFVIKVTDKPK